MLSLFSTSSDKAGFRLQYMEVYNWGTFHEKIFKINPKGNNSLLTGANASGKSTYIDALLTLLVPEKKIDFTINHPELTRRAIEQKKPMCVVIMEPYNEKVN